MLDINIILVGLLLVTNTLLMAQSMPHMSAKRKAEIVFEIAYSLVWEAERLWGDKSGPIKRAYVKAKFYILVSSLPTFRYSIIDGNKVDEVINQAVDLMQKYKSEVNQG